MRVGVFENERDVFAVVKYMQLHLNIQFHVFCPFSP